MKDAGELQSFFLRLVGEGTGSNPLRCSLASDRQRVNAMPLQPVAQAAVADRNLKSVRFAMKDGSRQISVFVSSPALESIEIAPLGDDGHFPRSSSIGKRSNRSPVESSTWVTSSRMALSAFAQGTYPWRACTSPGGVTDLRPPGKPWRTFGVVFVGFDAGATGSGWEGRFSQFSELEENACELS